MKRYFLYINQLLKFITRPWRKLPKSAKLTLLVLVIAGGFYWMLTNPIYRSTEDGTPLKDIDAFQQKKSGTLTKGTPEYKTYLPEGKTAESFGGWTRISPPNRNPVYAYADKLGGTPISVSQQPLPKEFQRNIDQHVSELAKNYNADHFITVDGRKVYIGTSAKGPQSVIFIKDQTLILIKSSAALSDDRWTSYVHSLR